MPALAVIVSGAIVALTCIGLLVFTVSTDFQLQRYQAGYCTITAKQLLGRAKSSTLAVLPRPQGRLPAADQRRGSRARSRLDAGSLLWYKYNWETTRAAGLFSDTSFDTQLRPDARSGWTGRKGMQTQTTWVRQEGTTVRLMAGQLHASLRMERRW